MTFNAVAPSAGTPARKRCAPHPSSTLTVVGLWILAVVSRPLNAGRVGVSGWFAWCAALVALLNLPLAQDFFILSWPPTGLLLAALATGTGGGFAIELLAWLHGPQSFPADSGGWWFCVLKAQAPTVVVGVLDRNGVPAVTYSPTPSRVQYHRRCGS